MSSIDQENLRQAEQRARMHQATDRDSSRAVWFLGALGVVVIIAVLFTFGTGGAPAVDAEGSVAPVVEETAPVPATD